MDLFVTVLKAGGRHYALLDAGSMRPTSQFAPGTVIIFSVRDEKEEPLLEDIKAECRQRGINPGSVVNLPEIMKNLQEEVDRQHARC